MGSGKLGTIRLWWDKGAGWGGGRGGWVRCRWGGVCRVGWGGVVWCGVGVGWGGVGWGYSNSIRWHFKYPLCKLSVGYV